MPILTMASAAHAVAPAAVVTSSPGCEPPLLAGGAWLPALLTSPASLARPFPANVGNVGRDGHGRAVSTTVVKGD